MDHNISGYLGWPKKFAHIKWDVPAGALNANIFSYTLSNVFGNVTVSPDYPFPSESIIEFDLIILLKLGRINYELVDEKTLEISKKEVGRSSLYTSYLMDFLLPNGQKIGFWKIDAYNFLPFRIKWNADSITSAIKALYILNTRSVAAKFINDFCKKEYILDQFFSQCEDNIVF